MDPRGVPSLAPRLALQQAWAAWSFPHQIMKFLVDFSGRSTSCASHCKREKLHGVLSLLQVDLRAGRGVLMGVNSADWAHPTQWRNVVLNETGTESASYTSDGASEAYWRPDLLLGAI